MARFEDAYEQYEALVRGFLTRLCGNRHLAEDLTQETFYQAMRHWNDFRGESSLSTWLCTIAKRLYYNECRRAPSLPLREAEARADESDLAQRLIDGDQRVALFSLLHRLQEPYREVFTLRTFGELSHAEIAALFGKSESWARVTYHRARQLLRRMAEEEMSDET